MLDLKLQIDNLDWVRPLAPGPAKSPAEEVCPDTAGQAADRVHRRSMLRMAENLHFSDSSTSRIAEVRRRAET